MIIGDDFIYKATLSIFFHIQVLGKQNYLYFCGNKPEQYGNNT